MRLKLPSQLAMRAGQARHKVMGRMVWLRPMNLERLVPVLLLAWQVRQRRLVRVQLRARLMWILLRPRLIRLTRLARERAKDCRPSRADVRLVW